MSGLGVPAARPLRVLQLHNRQLTFGGADIEADRERDLLAAAGHHVERIEVDNASIEEIGVARAAGKAIWNGAAARDLERTLEQDRPDVVHAHSIYPLLGPAPLRVAARAGVPVVMTLNDYRLMCVNGLLQRDGAPCELCVGTRTRWNGVRHRCYHDSAIGSATLATSLVVHRAARTFQRVSAYLCVSEFVRRRFVRDGFPPEQLHVHQNFCDDPGPAVEQRERSVVFVGRLIPTKGVATLLAAWARMEDPPLLHIAGDGPMRPEVEAAAEANPTIRFHGWLPSEDAQAIVGRASYTVLPSEWYEAGPLVFLESLAAATPVITSHLGTMGETIEATRAGFVFQAGDVDGLASSVTEAFDPAVDGAELRRRARAIYDAAHTPEAALRRLLAVYDHVIDR